MRTTLMTGLASLIALSMIIGCGPTETAKPKKPTTTYTDTTDTPSATEPDTTDTSSTGTPDSTDDVAPPAAGGFGDLVGRFVFDGSKADAAKLTVTKDQEFCGKHDLVDESIVVGDDGGLANVVVYLYVKSGEPAPKAHESYASLPPQVPFDNVNCRFEPHICLVTIGQKLVVGNKDPVGHNTKIDTQANSAINENLPTGATIEKEFTEVELSPAVVSCSIHPWMRGYILVRESPYSAVSNEKGEFKIENLPTGKFKFQVWHEKGRPQKVTVGGKSEKWSKGRFEIAINPGENSLGDVKIAASELD